MSEVGAPNWPKLPIVIRNCLRVHIGGGLIDVHTKAYRQPWDWKLTLAPEIARELGQSLITAADMATPKP